MTFLKFTSFFLLAVALVACGSDAKIPASRDAADETDQSSDDGESTDSESVDSESVDTDSTDTDSTDSEANGAAASAPKDAGRSSSGAVKDTGGSKVESHDSGSPASIPKDSGTSQGDDAGSQATAVDASSTGDDFTLPDLFPETPDASSSTSTSGTGTRDPNGPCKDLELFCFDIFDMFIFNPSDCFTCNNGKGCEGCAIPFAY